MQRLVICLLFVVLSGCASSGLRPSVFTSVPRYLAAFPIGTLSEADLVAQVGPPARSVDYPAGRGLVYEVGEGYGLRTYTYIVKGGVVSDVLYNDNSSWNGKTAKTERGK